MLGGGSPAPEGLRLADSLAPTWWRWRRRDRGRSRSYGAACVTVLVAARKLREICEAKVKTDRGRRRCALAAGSRVGAERTRRSPCRRRGSCVSRTRSKNEAHAVLMRNLCGRPPMTDCFGKSGRVWLDALELPRDERLTLDGCLRQIDFLDGELRDAREGDGRTRAGSAAHQTADDRPGRQRLIRRRRSSPPSATSTLPDSAPTRRLSRPGPAASASVRATPTHATAASATGELRSRVRCSAKPLFVASARPARCMPSSSVSAPQRQRRSHRHATRASSCCCSGTCSPASEDYAFARPS